MTPDSTPSPTRSGEREEIARVIDPWAFDPLSKARRIHRTRALEKADALIALGYCKPAPDAPDAATPIPVEIARELIRRWNETAASLSESNGTYDDGRAYQLRIAARDLDSVLYEMGAPSSSDAPALTEESGDERIQRLEDEAVGAVAAWWMETTGYTDLAEPARDFLLHPSHERGGGCPALTSASLETGPLTDAQVRMEQVVFGALAPDVLGERRGPVAARIAAALAARAPTTTGEGA